MESTAGHLTEQDLELVEFARSIVESHGDGEVHTVGAAIRDVQGRMYGGINVHHFTGGPCAEIVALGHARASGARELETIVAVGDEGRGVLAPCGRDRQLLLDLHPSIEVLMPWGESLQRVPISELLPQAYVRAGHPVPPVIRFGADYLPLVRSGRKTTTVRLGKSALPGPAKLIFELEDEVTLDAAVTRVVPKRADELDDADALADGFRDREELWERLRIHYPDISPNDLVAIVHFELEPMAQPTA